MHDAVRSGPRLRRATLPVAALHQHLVGLTDERRGSVGRDTLLQRDQTVEPVLHDRLGDLLLEARRPRARTGRVLEHVRAVETGGFHHLERLLEVLLGLPGKPTMMSVETAIPSIAVRMRSSQPR